jgi:aminobenzoyl-glutamate transport protein
VILCFFIFILSAIISNMGVSVVNPATNENLNVVNLLDKAQLQIYLGSVVSNFQGFAPLGVVLVAIIGTGVAEKSGFMKALMIKVVSKVPKNIITLTVIFTGIVANAVADVGYVVLPPLAAIVFLGIGRHQLIGMFAGFAGVAGGFSTNIMVSVLDVL